MRRWGVHVCINVTTPLLSIDCDKTHRFFVRMSSTLINGDVFVY
jgi:hypothetical protein